MLANVFPEELERIRTGNGDGGEQSRLRDARKLVGELPEIAAVKHLAHRRVGIPRSLVRPPPRDLHPEEQRRLDEQLWTRCAVPPVQLFATCLGDLVFPDAVTDAATLLERAGFEVEFPRRRCAAASRRTTQGTRRRVSRRAHLHWRVRPVHADVLPVGIVRDDGRPLPAGGVGTDAYDVWELSAFLDHHAIEPSARMGGSGSPTTTRAISCVSSAFEPAPAPARALEQSGVRCRASDLCCGFGGTFSVRQPEISIAMADDKLAVRPARTRW